MQQFERSTCALQKEELPLPRPAAEATPAALVMGAAQDSIVDDVDCNLLASYYGTTAKIINGSGHDVMLDVKWQNFAKELAAFAQQQT